MKDSDIMSFGKYGPDGEGRQIKDVPADYLLYVYGEYDNLEEDYPGVYEYIDKNFEILEQEIEEGTWDEY